MITQIEGVRIDQEQFPETYRIVKRIRKIAGQFKCPIEDLLQESMLLEFQLITDPREFKSKAGYIIISLIHKQTSTYRKHSRTISIEDIPDQDNKAFAVYIRKDIFPSMIVKDTLDAIGRKDKELQYMLTRRIQHEDKAWRRVHKMYFRSKNNTWFFNKVHEIKDMTQKVRNQYIGVMHEARVQ